jgi:hypothetical protein
MAVSYAKKRIFNGLVLLLSGLGGEPTFAEAW